MMLHLRAVGPEPGCHNEWLPQALLTYTFRLQCIDTVGWAASWASHL